MVEVICNFCHGKFVTKLCFVKKRQGKFCSRDCYDKERGNTQKFECFTCRKKIDRTFSEVEKSKSKNFFCSKSCQTIWRNKFYSGLKSKRWVDGNSKYRKILLSSGRKMTCKHCGNSDSRVLAVHHSDQDHSNNKLENLVWLCHNCHHLVHYSK